MENSFSECLKDFGLTGIEAAVYETLLRHGAMTGYEVSKETGISRSNVYSSLSGLVDKGAAYVSEGEASKYFPVEVSKFTDNSLRELKRKAELLVKNAPKPLEKADGYITISGTRHIRDKILEMLSECSYRVYVMAEASLLKDYEKELCKLASEGKKIVVLTEGMEIEGAIMYRTKPLPGQIRLITDSAYVLTGTIADKEDDTCLYSGQQNLVAVMKEALKNRIVLLELKQQEDEE